MELSKARILHISKYYYPFLGGTEQIARETVKTLIEAGAEQKIICFSESKEDSIDRIDGIEVVRAGVNMTVVSQGISRSYGRLLKKTIRDFRPTVVIFHYPNPFVAYYLLRMLPDSCRLIIYWHLDIVKQKLLKQFFIGQNKKLIRRADRLIATSPNYVDGSPWLSGAKEKCVVIPNCVDTERLLPTPESQARAAEIREANRGKIICLAVGRHTEYKGYRYLIRAAKLLDDRFRIYIAGSGEETDNLKAEAGEDRRIIFTGRLEDAELKGYLEAMDIFCFPSVTKNEAFGVALAEGMYYGKPAVTFTIPGSGVNFVCLDDEDGIEVPNRDIEAYAAALRKLAGDQELRESMGKAAKRRIEESFTPEVFRKALLTLLEGLDETGRGKEI